MNGERFLVLKLEKLIFFTNCGKYSARVSEMRCSPHLHFLLHNKRLLCGSHAVTLLEMIVVFNQWNMYGLTILFQS